MIDVLPVIFQLLVNQGAPDELFLFRAEEHLIRLLSETHVVSIIWIGIVSNVIPRRRDLELP